MSTNPHQTQSKPDGYPAPPIPRNTFQGAKGVIINGGTLSTTFGSSTVVNNYNIKHQYPGGPVPSRAYGYTNGSNFFIGGGGSTYTTYYSSQPNSYTVLPSAGITMETHTGDQMFSGTFPGNSINLHNSPHATTVCNESVISISSLGSSTRVRQGHPQIYMSGANGFPFAPSTPSSRDAQWSQGQDRTTRRQGGPSEFVRCIPSIQI